VKNQSKLLLFLLVLTANLSAQELPARTMQPGIGQMPLKRDKAKEDQVAKLFEAVRVDAKLPHLTRISARDSLSQTVCTIAAAGKLPLFVPSPANGINGAYNVPFPVNRMSEFYNTTQPQSVSPELKRVASHNEIRSPVPARYSVVVWRADDEKNESTYWVGVQLYWSAGWEFFGNHFTDDIEYRNDWKKSIAAECRGK
jgi:hypothetical protein